MSRFGLLPAIVHVFRMGPPANNCFFSSFGHKWQDISLHRFTCKQFNSLILLCFVLGANGKSIEKERNPNIKDQGGQTCGVPLIFWMPLDFAFCSHCSNLIGQRDLLFTPRYIISPVHRSCVFSVATFFTNITTMFPVCSPHVFNDVFQVPNEFPIAAQFHPIWIAHIAHSSPFSP